MSRMKKLYALNLFLTRRTVSLLQLQVPFYQKKTEHLNQDKLEQGDIFLSG